MSDRERSLSQAVSRGNAVGTTLNALRSVDKRTYGNPIGSSSNIHKRNQAANQGAGALALQAAQENMALDQEDMGEKVAALKYGQGKTTAVSGKHNAAQGLLQRSQILGKQISDAQAERNQAAAYDLAGNAVAEAGRLAYDSQVTGDGGGFGGWLADHGFKRPGTDSAASLYDEARNNSNLTKAQREALFTPTSFTGRLFR